MHIHKLQTVWAGTGGEVTTHQHMYGACWLHGPVVRLSAAAVRTFAAVFSWVKIVAVAAVWRYTRLLTVLLFHQTMHAYVVTLRLHRGKCVMMLLM